MKVYLEYFKEQEMQADENPPIGILLCTDKNETLVRYATTGNEKQFQVSKYKLQLPSQEELTAFIQAERQQLEH